MAAAEALSWTASSGRKRASRRQACIGLKRIGVKVLLMLRARATPR
jgi:hypothetical protein